VLSVLGGACLVLLTTSIPALAQEQAAEEYPGPSHYLRGAYQWGKVLQTNDFLKGQNNAGTPIDQFHSVRLEFGWQTDGSKDWHHNYNFPSFGIGLYGADYFNDEELGKPTSLYGFFDWPLGRPGRWQFNFGLAFGLTNNWRPYDPENNPYNTATGLGRSVHIEGGPNMQYRFAKRWSGVLGLTFTHFSNGGTQLPNHGINQVGPVLFVKYDTDTPVTPPIKRDIGDYDHSWDLTVTGSVGKRNLDLQVKDVNFPDEYKNQSYFIGNTTVGAGRRFSHKSRYVFGLDLCYDESVGDLQKVNAYNAGQNIPEPSSWDNFDLAVFGGYEIIGNRTHVLVHFGYKLLYKDIEGRLPEFYQRLGVKQFFYQKWFAGLNVRFHELGSADNLEWNIGYQMGL
jgi:hypothetical protein